jgi:predicted DNA-binding transcriptional regulator AlpA
MTVPAHASTPTPQGTPAYLTPADVAAMLQINVKSVYRLAKSDVTFPSIKLGAGRNAAVRFPRERLERWLRDREQGRPRTGKQMLTSVKSSTSPAPTAGCADGCANGAGT